MPGKHPLLCSLPFLKIHCVSLQHLCSCSSSPALSCTNKDLSWSIPVPLCSGMLLSSCWRAAPGFACLLIEMQKFTVQAELITPDYACTESQTNPQINNVSPLCSFPLLSLPSFFSVTSIPPLASAPWFLMCPRPSSLSTSHKPCFPCPASSSFSNREIGSQKWPSAAAAAALFWSSGKAPVAPQAQVWSFHPDTIGGEGGSKKLSQVQLVTVH